MSSINLIVKFKGENMKRVVLVFTVLMVFLQTTFSQNSDVTKIKMVLIPREWASIWVLNQPSCQIKFEKLDLLTDEKASKRVLKYEIRNLSSKNIKSISINEFYSNKAGYWTRLGGQKSSTFSVEGDGIKSGATFENYSYVKVILVGMTKEVESIFRSKSDDRKIMKLSVMVMIKKIIFDDDSEINFEPLAENISEFID